MKKALFIIAALASCMTVSAKYWFGGSLGFNSQTAYNTDNKQKVQYFCPEFGMAIEDALEIGVDLNIKNPISFTGQQKFSFGFAPFLRYTFLNDNNFHMFVQGGFEYEVVSPSGFNYWNFGVNIQPGIRYDLADQWSVVAKFEGLCYKHTSEPEIPYPGNKLNNYFGLGADFSALSFGLIYEF